MDHYAFENAKKWQWKLEVSGRVDWTILVYTYINYKQITMIIWSKLTNSA